MSRRTVKDVLREALKLIRKPERWTQGAYARDKDGDTCAPGGGRSVCWCAVGAVREVTRGHVLRYRAVNLLNEHTDHSTQNIIWSNDRVGHGAVVETFKRAIKAASKAKR